MRRFCLRDDSALDAVSVVDSSALVEHAEMITSTTRPPIRLGSKIVVRRCPACGQVTFWDDYDSIQSEKQQVLKAHADD